MDKKTFVDRLKKFGWKFEENTLGALVLPNEIKNRYLSIPDSLLNFLGKYKHAINKEDNEWFLCSEDYERDEPDTFHWNEFERISLKAGQDDRDEEVLQRVIAFWDKHFPFYMAVEGDYRFAAMIISGEDRGRIVYGYEPMFEEASIVADNLEAFFDDFIYEKEEEYEDNEKVISIQIKPKLAPEMNEKEVIGAFQNLIGEDGVDVEAGEFNNERYLTIEVYCEDTIETWEKIKDFLYEKSSCAEVLKMATIAHGESDDGYFLLYHYDKNEMKNAFKEVRYL